MMPLKCLYFTLMKLIIVQKTSDEGTFKFGDQFEIGQDGIHRETPKTPASVTKSPNSDTTIDFSNASTSSIGGTWSSTNISDQHIQYDDLEEICKLGRGASATVSKVIHKKTKKVYAMKRINVDLQDQKPKLIVSEFKALYNSDCPYVMTLYDAYYRQGSILMILEFMGRLTSGIYDNCNRLWIT